jgi:hypothetical protein
MNYNNNGNGNNNMDNNIGIAAYVQNRLKESAHPTACIFHVLFKVCALTPTFWVLVRWLAVTAVVSKVTVKRILLPSPSPVFSCWRRTLGRQERDGRCWWDRWWNQVHDDDTKWIFECADDDRVVNKFDQSIFDRTVRDFARWALLFITGLLVNWLLIVCIALCHRAVTCTVLRSKDQNVKFSANDANHGATAMHVMRTNMLSVLTGNDCEWRQWWWW